MPRSKKLRTGALFLSVFFTQLSLADQEPDRSLTGVWKNANVGTVKIQPCKNDISKFCGYLQSASKKAREEFELRVEDSSAGVKGILVMSDLSMNTDGTEMNEGRFRNSDSITAEESVIKINCSKDGVLNVNASIGWLNDDFKFTRVEKKPPFK